MAQTVRWRGGVHTLALLEGRGKVSLGKVLRQKLTRDVFPAFLLIPGNAGILLCFQVLSPPFLHEVGSGSLCAFVNEVLFYY